MRIFSAILAGFIGGLLIYFIALAAAVKTALFLFLTGWAAFTFVFYRGAESTGQVWARACLAVGVEVLAIPPVLRLTSLFGNSQAVQAAKQGAQAGQALLPAAGASVISTLAGYIGLFIGFILLATAYCSLRPARRKR